VHSLKGLEEMPTISKLQNNNEGFLSNTNKSDPNKNQNVLFNPLKSTKRKHKDNRYNIFEHLSDESDFESGSEHIEHSQQGEVDKKDSH